MREDIDPMPPAASLEPELAELGSSDEFEGCPKRNDVLLGRYRVDEPRQGGFAVVLLVTDLETERLFAVKLPNGCPGSAAMRKTSEVDFRAYQSEVEFWLHLDSHPNIVKADSVRVIEGQPALFMEYVGGGTYDNLREQLKPGALEKVQAIGFAHQICLGMEFANRKEEVAHLDLKPENVLISSDNTLKVSDFGLAHRVCVVGGAYPTSNAATWRYAAPEIFGGQADDSRSDTYSFGVILYEMVTGQLPYPFRLSGNLKQDSPRLKEFHQGLGMRKISQDLYWKGVPGIEDRALGIILSGCLDAYQSSRLRFARVLEMLERAYPWLKRPQAAGPPLPDDLLQRAVALREIGRLDESMSEFNALLVKYPKRGIVWLEAARTLEATGNYQESNEFEERALELDPSLRTKAEDKA